MQIDLNSGISGDRQNTRKLGLGARTICSRHVDISNSVLGLSMWDPKLIDEAFEVSAWLVDHLEQDSAIGREKLLDLKTNIFDQQNCVANNNRCGAVRRGDDGNSRSGCSWTTEKLERRPAKWKKNRHDKVSGQMEKRLGPKDVSCRLHTQRM